MDTLNNTHPSQSTLLATTAASDSIRHVLATGLMEALYPEKLNLLPQVNELYEFELAYAEAKTLSDEEIIDHGAYFSTVNNQFTKHYLMCEGEPIRLPQHSSSGLKAFFKTNLFKTGYATHGLFPYRGKFHPQMIKGLINALGLRKGETVLDPMMGSGTVLVEACLMGVNSIGFDASPFCQFMTQTKLTGLTVPLAPLTRALNDARNTFNALKAKSNKSIIVNGAFRSKQQDKEISHQDAEDFLLLAYLDSAGYVERSKNKSHFEQFCAVLERYLFVVEKNHRILQGVTTHLGLAEPKIGDARNLPLANESIDGIIFSPPYSFAIDYLMNDAFHLNHFGVDVDRLRDNMVGLRGKNTRDKYHLYKSDMQAVMNECSRVLKRGKFCCVIVGTNNNQIGRALNISPDRVQGIDELIVSLGENNSLQLVRKLARQIMGMANTMRNEYIVILQKVKD